MGRAQLEESAQLEEFKSTSCVIFCKMYILHIYMNIDLFNVMEKDSMKDIHLL